MRALLIRLGCLASVLMAASESASAVTMGWTFVGNPENPADTQVMTCCGASAGTSGYGSVPYAYYIGTYEVTNSQYAEFLNDKAASDPLALYDQRMNSNALGGITQTGSSGSYSYSV